MTILSRPLTSVSPDRPQVKIANLPDVPAPCSRLAETAGLGCHAATRPVDWCGPCARASVRAANRAAEGLPPGEPTLPMADWIEVKAQELRLLGTDLGDWLAAKVDELASECRWLDAVTPDQFDERAACHLGAVSDHDRLTDQDVYPHGVC